MTDPRPSRREVLKRLGGGAAALGSGAGAALLAFDDGTEQPELATGISRAIDRRPAPDPSLPDLVVARRGSPGDIVRAALEAVGGIGRFVERGDEVLIKPNIGWDRVPLMAANTNPEVVATLVRLCREAGARQVVVGDVSCNDPRRAYDRSGIAAAAREAGAEVVLPEPSRFVVTHLGGTVLQRWPVFEPALRCDKIFNVPVAKNHTLAGFTCALKNWYGLLGGTRRRLHQSIHSSIADLAAHFAPTLTLVDAVRVMHRGGPTGGDVSDTRRLDTVIASTDQVGADARACSLIDIRASDLPYLRQAERLGAGRADLDALTVREVEVG